MARKIGIRLLLAGMVLFGYQTWSAAQNPVPSPSVWDGGDGLPPKACPPRC